MSGSTLPKELLNPSGYLIPRVVDQLSFCYLHMAIVTQDRTGVLVTTKSEDEVVRAYLPTSSIAALLLGPGVRITHAAISTLARHGTSVVFVGTDGVRCYSTVRGASSTELLLAVARTVSDDDLRLAAAQRMYALRFGMKVPPQATMAQLRGMEGARMRETYKALAKRHRVAFRRQYTTNDFDEADPVNQALSSANTCLYGIVGAALGALGVPAGLGVVHTGHRDSLVYDIADLYKAEITIPLAFEFAKATDPANAVRRSFRASLVLTKLLPRIVHDIHHVFGLGPEGPRPEPRSVPLTSLWDSEGDVAGGVNHGVGVEKPLESDEEDLAEPLGIEDF